MFTRPCLYILCVAAQGLIQSAFLWGYTATQLLGGSLADKYGGRAVIAFGEGHHSAISTT
jgi:ACS family sodium-dependent inorganic phosphate cotransporter/ACS family sodium-dependent inorganic phosphate cotransporter-like MFS transporter 9